MERREYNAENPTYRIVDYVAGEDCKVRIIRCNFHLGVAPSESYELWDGTRWYAVPEQVFRLWLEAYESGRRAGEMGRRPAW